MKVGTTEKLKFKRLQRRLDLPMWQAVGLLESLWKLTYENTPDGAIGRLTNEDIAAAIEWKQDADELIAALVDTQWLDADEEFRLIVHDWHEHCASFLRGNFSKHGKLFANEVAKHRKTGGDSFAKQGRNGVSDPATNPHQSNPIQSTPSSTTTGDADADEVSFDEWKKCIPTAKKLAKLIGHNRQLSDTEREWAAKIAVLSRRHGKGWLEVAMEGVKHAKPDKPIAYMHSILDKECERKGTRLLRELSNVDVTTVLSARSISILESSHA